MTRTLAWMAIAVIFMWLPLATAQPTAEEQNTVSIFQRSNAAVVHIRAVQRPVAPGIGAPAEESTGSGFFIDASGYLITNYHVIGSSSELQLVTATGETHRLTVVGTAPAFDIAVLKPATASGGPALTVSALEVGDSTTLAVGQKVLVIGNPLGLHNTLTTGIISGLARDLPGAPAGLGQTFIQTDAAINPGNSGGPLLDSGGKVIGVNTVIARDNQNLGFAIPIEVVKKILPDLIRMGHVYRPLLGFSAKPISTELKGLFDIPATNGLLVEEVIPNTPAHAAGLVPGDRVIPLNDTVYVLGGDIIVAVDGKAVKSPRDLEGYLLGSRPGQSVALTVLRKGQRHELELILPEMHL